jgi:hypothetical protein
MEYVFQGQDHQQHHQYLHSRLLKYWIQAERFALLGMNYFLLSASSSVGRGQSGTDCARITALLLALLLSIWSGFGQHFQQGCARRGERWVRVPPFAPLIPGRMTAKTLNLSLFLHEM